ncbi:cytochrome P450 CYP5099A1 [Xylariales sp. AK1849]|nr:cytochrome P450 CYP5099A1 [Xylariales sp. AK1849]
MLFIPLLFLSAVSLCITIYATALPRHFPRNIPVVPLWLQVYDVMRGASKSDVYNARIRGPIEKHGAVALWHEGCWTILATRPEYLVKIFKNSERTLTKKGLAERVPWGSGAKLFGINIIDSDGDLYAQFRKLLKPGFSIQAPMAFMKAKSGWLAEQLCKTQDSAGSDTGIRIGPSVWRWALSVWGDYFLDAQFGPLDYTQYNIQQILGVQNSKLLGRAKGLFPILDRLPWTLPVTQHTDKLLHQVEVALYDLAETRSKSPPSLGGENRVGFLLHQARQQNEISDFHYGCNLKQLFIAGHENVETVLNSAMEELGTNTRVQDLLHAEVTRLLPTDYSTKDLDQLPLLNAVIYETLRLYPPLGHMTNRLTTEPFQLDSDILIPPGVMLGWHAYGIQTDPQVWGESARQFDPFRWGMDTASVKHMLRNRQARGQYIPFGIYSRKCLGYTISLQLLQCTIAELVRNLEWKHPTGYKFSYGKAALVVPDNITLVVRKREYAGELIVEKSQLSEG